MNWNSLVDPHFIDSLGWTLIHSLWQIALVSLLLWFGLHLIEPTRANLRYGISVAALLFCLAIPAATFVRIVSSEQPARFAVQDLHRDYDDFGSNDLGTRANLAADSGARSTDVEGAAWIRSATVEGLGQFADKYIPAMFPYSVAAWLLGMLFFSLRLGGGLVQLGNYQRRDIVKVPDEWIERFHTLSGTLGIKRAVGFVSSGTLVSPIAVGIIRPVIIIPCALFLQVDPRQLETVIAHELIHIRRHDPLVNLFQVFIETILFYHPCVWWISKQVRREREFAADAAVLESFSDGRVTYAAALASLEEIRLSTDQTTPRLATAANGGNLMQRIQRILNEKTEIRSVSSAWSAILALALISAVLLSVFSFTSSSAVNAERLMGERKLAIGFVSIPPVDRSSDPPKDSDATARLLIAKLQKFKVPAIGFVNGGQISDGQKLFPVRANIVRLWRDAGLEVGIGSYKHIWFYNTPYDEYVAAVEKNESITRKLLDEKNIPIRYFSYPYLNTGKNADERDRFEQWLSARNIRSVKYTIDNNEWMYSYAYDMARNDNDVNTMNEIQADFIRYMSKMFDHYEAYSKEMFGRDIAETMVLTPSRLVADSADELFEMIRDRGYRFVSMDEALSDEAYKTPENMFGNFGNSWFERWTYSQGKKLREEPSVDAEVYSIWKARNPNSK